VAPSLCEPWRIPRRSHSSNFNEIQYNLALVSLQGTRFTSSIFVAIKSREDRQTGYRPSGASSGSLLLNPLLLLLLRSTARRTKRNKRAACGDGPLLYFSSYTPEEISC